MDELTIGLKQAIIAGTENLKTEPTKGPAAELPNEDAKGQNLKAQGPRATVPERRPEKSSILETAQRSEDEDEAWTSSLESCMNLTLRGNFNVFADEHAPKPQESLEDQLEQYFARTLENYSGYLRRDPTQPSKARPSAARDKPSKAANHECGKKPLSPEGTIISTPNAANVLISNSNESTDCGICDYPPTKTSPSPAIPAPQHREPQSTFNGFADNSIGDSISVNANNAAEEPAPASAASAASAFTSASHSTRLQPAAADARAAAQAQDAGALTPRDPAYDQFMCLKDMMAADNYFKPMGNKEIDYIFNTMDSLSTVDNLLNKDTSDFGLPPKEFHLDLLADYNADLNHDLLNNDALFSEVYRDKDVDSSESWELLMRNLSLSRQRRHFAPHPEPANTNSSATVSSGSLPTAAANPSFATLKDVSELGINLKNKENIPSILPSDPNLGFKKTSLCKYWQRGICANNDCNFAHGKKELRSTIGVWRTTICHHWKTGVCRVGKDCRHAHGEEELQPKNIPANVLKNKLLNSARKYEYMRKKKSTSLNLA